MPNLVFQYLSQKTQNQDFLQGSLEMVKKWEPGSEMKIVFGSSKKGSGGQDPHKFSKSRFSDKLKIPYQTFEITSTTFYCPVQGIS